MKDKILILAIYPAPYRLSLFEKFEELYQVDVYFEYSSGDQRRQEWFKKGNYSVLEDKESYKQFKQLDLKDYKLILIYDYSTVKSLKLIAKCKAKKVPYVLNCDGVMMTVHGNFIKDMVKKYAIKGATKYFASGLNAKKYFLRYGAREEDVVLHTFSTLEDCDVLNKPLTAEEKVVLRRQLNLPIDKRLAIAVGRFIPLKRYAELIEEWKNMPKDIVLVLIGGGSEVVRYKGIMSNNSLDNVIILDFLAKDQLFEYFKAADIFVHPTSYDVWGLVVNEAMACGLPVVVSDHCVAGLELVKDGENGFLSKMGDEKAFCVKVQEIFENNDLYEMGKNSLKTIKSYTITNMANVQLKAIEEVIADAKNYN